MLFFIEEQLLRMRWLHDGVTWLLDQVFHTGFSASPLGNSIHFFIYDFIKISLLLSVFIFIISYIQSYFPPERTKRILGKYRGIGANFMGAILGTITPFCSCSSIPLFIGFTKAGLPTGVTFSFLISSPLVDLGAFILLSSIFGFPIAIAYVVVGLILAVIGGTIIDRSRFKSEVEDFVKEPLTIEVESAHLQQKDRLSYAKEQMLFTYRRVVIYIVIGVSLGAVIHNYIPESIIQSVLGSNNIFSVLIATGIGIPMYADIFGTIPIAQALFAKGVKLGTILALMMSVTATSIPSLIMLSQVVKSKLLFFFIVVVVTGIIIIGYLFNAFHYLFV